MNNDKISFEAGLRRLEEISALMNDRSERELPLEESVKLYGEALELIAVCKKRIETAKLTVERLENERNDN